MSFDVSGLSLFSPTSTDGESPAPCVWRYDTTDSSATAANAAYWDGAQGILRPGDTLCIRASDGGRAYRVSHWSPTQVALSPFADDVATDGFTWEF